MMAMGLSHAVVLDRPHAETATRALFLTLCAHAKTTHVSGQDPHILDSLSEADNHGAHRSEGHGWG